jgi:hypothetical protein
MTETIQVCLLDFNKGQLTGLPKNPRFFRDYRFEAMKKSIQDSPEMLELRELIIFPYNDGRYIVVCGNLRLRACKELGYKELPCKVLAPDTPVKKLREYATKDNVNFGENDLDVMENEWNKAELQDWGIEFGPEKKEDEFKERFDAPLRMIQPFILLFQSMMKNMSYLSLLQAMRLIVTGSVKGWICST